MLKKPQVENLRTVAIDRQHEGSKRGLLTGTTPLKSRPAFLQDFGAFTSPHSGKRSLSRNQKKARDLKQVDESSFFYANKR